MTLNFDEGKLQTLQKLLVERLNEVFLALDVQVVRTGKSYSGACPVHGGDNTHALQLYHDGYSVPGYWRCYTRSCEQVFKKTILGFIRGVLSHKHCKWDGGKNCEKYNWKKTIDFCCNIVGIPYSKITASHLQNEKRDFIRNINIIAPEKQKETYWTKQQVHSNLAIPSPYFIKRGWSSHTLERYDVGTCLNPSKPFYERVVVPIYDDSNNRILSITGRSIYEKCGSCQCHHNPSSACPKTQQEKDRYCKWKNLGKPVERTLYNWWYAKKVIEKTGYACLVEGPGDLWRLEEAGIHVGLGLFGVNLTDSQQILLEMSGATSIIVLTNEDEAGRKARTEIQNKLRRCFRILTPQLPANDLGDMKPKEVGDFLGPLIRSVERK